MPLLKMLLRSHCNVIVIPSTAAALVVVVAALVVVVAAIVVVAALLDGLLNHLPICPLLGALDAQPLALCPITSAQPLMRSSVIGTTNAALPMPTAHLPSPLLLWVVGLVGSAL